ncbi:MAG: hypothetical protein AAF430_21705 [Myxococcota bacterium]
MRARLSVACAIALVALAAHAQAAADWEISLDPAAPLEALSPALLGHYDLSGALYDYAGQPGLPARMQAIGFSEWRVSVGRWENSTQLFSTLTDGSPCPIPLPQMAASEPNDLALIASRDWFSDDGQPVTLADTNDDARYQLDYLREVIDTAATFGASSFVSFDAMPRALAVNPTPLRTNCSWSFQNRVSNIRPADAAVFAAAATGVVERIVEGVGAEPGRPVHYWEVGNEPEFPFFWDPDFEDQSGPLDRFFEMSIQTLVALDAYRSGSSHPDAGKLRFGLGSFATEAVTNTVLTGFDSAGVPGGFVPLDFISFHAYANDPLEVVDVITSVAATAAATTNYASIELALAEWGPNLATSAGDAAYAASMEPPLHIATVLALGATAGLDRAHRAIFWDFFPSSIQLGVVDHAGQPKPGYRAYELLALLIDPGARRLAAASQPDGRLDAGLGALLASQIGATTRVLVVNRNATARSVRISLAGAPARPHRIWRFEDPSGGISIAPGMGSQVTIAAESLAVLEFTPAPVPTAGLLAFLVLGVGIVAGVGWARRR